MIIKILFIFIVNWILLYWNSFIGWAWIIVNSEKHQISFFHWISGKRMNAGKNNKNGSTFGKFSIALLIFDSQLSPLASHFLKFSMGQEMKDEKWDALTIK